MDGTELTGQPAGWRILGFGRKPEVAAAVEARLQAEGMRAKAFALTDDHDADARLARELSRAGYHGGAIGGFIDGQNPAIRPTFQTTVWFNRVLNLVHSHASQAKIILVHDPGDVLPAIRRVLG